MASIMVQGTCSSAGKSFIAAALCRIFAEDGLKVFPFKSQNMSLNSYVTKEGLEMGRAQVLQAQAAMVEPSVLMNPILLKPTSDRKSQVIIKGKPLENMDAYEYYRRKKEFRGMIEDIFKKAESENDVVVIEGAGSPAEINLKKDDFVNMGMAEIADSPVLLVGDIDRGGVFASVYGTVMLLDEKERKRIKGIVINKFRGDKAILQSGLDMLEELVKIPVVGVIPYINLKLDEEDSVTVFNNKSGAGIDICVIRLPRISNFTDFDAFRFDEDVNVRYAGTPEELGNPDIIIIPGSKNTIEDLRWLKKTGLFDSIKDYSGMVFGICGGYQMMGSRIVDTEGWEVNKGECEEGLGIFDTVTEFTGEKVTTNVKGNALGCGIYGYEIHSGKTVGNKEPFVNINIKEGQRVSYTDGDMKDERYFGTYIHGIFDSRYFREYLLNNIRRKKSMDERFSEDLNTKREEEIKKLAKHVRENMDMEYIYSLIGGK